MSRPIRVGVAGLGRAFTLMLPTFTADPRVRLVAGADPLPAARDQFKRDFGGPAFGDVEQLCAQHDIDVVYVATPHQFHAAHTALAFAHGKHVLLEKPMAITLDECTEMIEASKRAGRRLVVGHSHSFNRPVARVRELCEQGDFGDVRMITAINFTDFLYRPRRPEELDTRSGGGVIFSQGAHQIDIVRLVGGGRLASVRAFTGAWDASRPTEGAYSALLRFECGAFAHATYSGYAHYDSDELMDSIGELGSRSRKATTVRPASGWTTPRMPPRKLGSRRHETTVARCTRARPSPCPWRGIISAFSSSVAIARIFARRRKALRSTPIASGASNRCHRLRFHGSR